MENMHNKSSTSTKHKKKPTSQLEAAEAEEQASSAKNEGVDLNWAYKPPPGVKPITTNEDNGEFDWDAVHDNDDVEIWVMRVPDTIKSKHLEGLSFDLSSASETMSRTGKRKTSRISTFNRKQTLYDVWSLGDDHGHDDRKDGNSTKTLESGHSHHPTTIGGEELESLSCLLPRKSKKGALYPSPKPIARRLIISARPPEPTTPTEPTLLPPNTNPPRHKYPPERLTHRFMPYGSLVNPNYIPSDKVTNEQLPPNPNTSSTLTSTAMEVDDEVVDDVDVTMHDDKVEEDEEGKQKAKKTQKKDKPKPKPKPKQHVEVVIETRAEPKTEKEKKGKKRKGVDQTDSKEPQKKTKKAKIVS